MSFYEKLKSETSQKYLDRYVPKDLTKAQKEKVSKIILARRSGKSDDVTPSYKRTRKSSFTTRFNKKFPDIESKSLKNLAKYFKIPPSVLKTVYDKGAAAWSSSGSRLGVNRQQWAKARVYKAILNILKGRENGIDEYPKRLQTEGHDFSQVKKAVEANSYIPLNT